MNLYTASCIVTVCVNAGTTCMTSPEQNCELFSFKSNVVTRNDIMEKNVTADIWLQIYVSDFTTHHSYGKCRLKWHLLGSDNVIRRQFMCYNFDKKMCEDFERRDEDDCGRAMDREDASDELELQRLPWHQISADLKNNFDLEFTDRTVMFTWKRPECGLDGEVIVSGSLGRRFDFLLLCSMLVFTYLF